MSPKYPGYSMYEAQPVIWSWACALVGIFLALRLKRWVELLWGGLFWVACTGAPVILVFAKRTDGVVGALASIAIGIGYFSWCYVKLERDKLTLKSLVESNPVSTQSVL